VKKLQLLLPDEIHSQFKAACALEGKDMTTVIREFIEKYIGKSGTKMKK